jgi:hypothetical protein
MVDRALTRRLTRTLTSTYNGGHFPKWALPEPVCKIPLRNGLGSVGQLNLGHGENTRIARAMYWDKADQIYKYAETPLTAAENQLVSNSDFSARSYGYDENVANPGLSGIGGTHFSGDGTVSGEWASGYDIYAGAGRTATLSKDENDYQVFSSSGGPTLFRSEATKTLTIGNHYLAVVEVEAITSTSQFRISDGSQADPATSFTNLSLGTNELYITATSANANQTVIVACDDGESVTISRISFKEMTLSEANSRMTGTGNDVLDGDGDMSSDPTSDWGGSEATDSWGESSYLRYTFTTVNTNKGAYKGATLTAGQRYYITFKARTDRSCSGGFSSIGDNVYTGNEVSNPTLSSDWQDYAFYITPTGTDLRLYMEDGGSIGDTLDFDDVTIVPVEHDWIPTSGREPLVFDVDDTVSGKMYIQPTGSAESQIGLLTGTIGHYYKATFNAQLIGTATGTWKFGASTGTLSDEDFGQIFTPTATEQSFTVYFINKWGAVYLGTSSATGADSAITIDNLVIEEVTLDDWTVDGTLSATLYLKYNEDDTVTFVRDTGLSPWIALKQDIGNELDWVSYTAVIDSVATGNVMLWSGSVWEYITSSGSYSGINQLAATYGGRIYIAQAGDTTFTISSFTAYPVPQTQAFEDGWALFGAEAENSALDSRGSAWEDSASWVNFASPTYGTLVSGFDGTVNAVPITDSNASGFSGPYQFITVDDADQTHTVCVFIKKDEDETRFPELSLQLSGGTTITQAVQINTKTGAYTARIGTTSYATVQSYGDFWRLCTTITNEAAKNNTQLAVDLKVARGKTLGGFDQDAIGTTTFDQVDVYLNTSGWIPNPIVTESSEVTKDADLARWEMSADFKKLFANEYGSEANPDVGFDTAGQWAVSGNCVVSGSAAAFTASGWSSVTRGDQNWEAGEWYKIEAVIANYVSGTSAFVYLHGSNSALINPTENGTYVAYIQANSGDDRISIGSSNLNADVTSLSYKKVTNLAQQTTVFKWKPGYDGTDHSNSNNGIIAVSDGSSSLAMNGWASELKTYDGTTAISSFLSYSVDTEYLIAIKSGYIVDNQLKFAIAIEPLSSTFDADSWKDSDVFDGAFALGTYLNLFYDGWGKMWMRDLELYDQILTDAQIEALK